MTSRINYNTPLKSVRTIRALKIEQYDPQKAFVDDAARPSDADLMNEAGIAFVWENAPGRSKVEQEKTEAASPVELKRPPQQVLAPPPNSRVSSVEVPKSPPPVPAGTEASGWSFHHLFDSSQVPPAGAPADTPAPPVKSYPSSNRQFPPKPTQSRAAQSGDRPPQARRNASAVSVSQSVHHSSALLLHNGGHEQPSARRTGKARGPDVLMAKEHHHHSSLASTLHALTSDNEPPPDPLTDPNGGRLIVPSPDEGALPNGFTRGNQDYFSARLHPSQSPALGVKDFYLSGRHTLHNAVPNSAQSSRANSCMPTRANSASASETGSHSDDGDQTDVGDAFSTMNTRDPDGRCQVSVLDGEQLESSSRHTDPRARDFIMERFLPAAKAMVTESPDSSDRRSSQETPVVSPTRKNGRSSLIGRSRFAFKDQFAEVKQEDVGQTDLLFKCKFPWQMGALRSAVPLITAAPDSDSAEHSPSPSCGKNKFSPSPTTSVGDLKDQSSPRPFSDAHDDDGAWIYAESGGSAAPRSDDVCSFEARGLPPKSRNKNGSAIPGSQQQHRSRETDYRDINRSLGVIGESADAEYESEHSGRSKNSSYRGSPGGVPKDRLKETATQGNCDMRSGPLGSTGRRSPEMPYLGSLGSLLRTTQQQRRDVGHNSDAAIQGAVENVQEPIPPSSILNHHRNGPSRTAVTMSTSVHASKHTSTTKSPYPGTGVLPDESSNYPKHLKLNLIRQPVAEPSGGSERSHESLNDEVWDDARDSLAFEDNHDQPGKVLRSESNNNSQLPGSANEGGPVNNSAWPLVKIQHMYAQTPSSDSKDASFSSVSDRSLRSPTNLALAIQQPLSTERSPVSVLQPPLPKSPAESWLFKVRPPVPPSTGAKWQGSKPKEFLGYSSRDDSMDVKWEVLVKSENAQVRNKMTQEVQRKGTGLEKLDILGSKAR